MARLPNSGQAPAALAEPDRQNSGPSSSHLYLDGLDESSPARPRVRLRSWLLGYGLPAALLAATVVTTTVNGARFMQNFREGIPPVVRDGDLWSWSWLFAHSQLFVTGFAFSLSLLGILLVHEFGHFFACRAHAIRATLPWVLPAPTLSGTVGAVIRILSPIPDRNALMDVGVYGPLAGYAASVIALVAGFALSVRAGIDVPGIRFGSEPLTIRFVHWLLLHWNPALPNFDHCAPHPVLVAGWIGLFITSLNLIPGGQLDGGHILYAISPRVHRIATNTLPFLLLAGGVFLWAGWLLWGAFLLIPALRHPRVSPERKLTRGRLVLGILGLAIFLLTFTPTPLHDNSLLQLLR